MHRKLIAILVLALVVTTAQAEKKKGLSIGDKAPTFTNLPGTDGKSYSSSDFKDKDVLVICITCNHCPVAVAYEDRIIDFTKKWATGDDSKVALVAVNVNVNNQDKLDKMKLRSKEKGFNFTYLYDESQKLGRQLGARVTPEFFVFNKKRELVYHGAMDNKMRNPTENYLIAAVKATVAGKKPEKQQTRPVGCGVQYKRN